MKVGDLVKMKHEMSRKLNNKKRYTEDFGIVYGLAGKGIKILMPDSCIKVSLVDYWEVIKECKN